MAKSFIPSDLVGYRYPDAINTPSLTDKNFLLTPQWTEFVFKNLSGQITTVRITGAMVNNLFVSANNGILTTI